MSEFERITELTPAFDRRDPDPSKNYGIHGVDLRMILRGPKGAVQFCVSTNWQLPNVRDEQMQRALGGLDRIGLKVAFLPFPYDVGFHSPVPMYDGQDPIEGDCPHVEGGTCYYDGSSLRAEKWFDEILLTRGSDGIWEALEQEYREFFEEEVAA